MTTAVVPLRSIQGEQQDDRAGGGVMSQEDVDRYVGSVDDAVLACRERGRHLYPSTRSGLRFVGVTDEGLLIRRAPCECCGLAIRVEFWDVRHHRGKVTRCELVTARVEYRSEYTDGGQLRSYVAPSGHGRVTPKLVRNALGTDALAGQSYRDLLKQAKQAEREAHRGN